MKNFYEKNRVYIWQNLAGIYTHLNGKETVVVGDIEVSAIGDLVQETDTPATSNKFRGLGAPKGCLRPKQLPPGEELISNIIKGKLHVNIGEKENV